MKKLVIASLLISQANAALASPTADIAILLDTSGSMQGLINQVRDGLWKTLNSLQGLKKGDEEAILRLALIEYGSGVVPAEANFMQILTPLTADHTRVAEKLFATKALGTEEYSGMAIDLAREDLAWSGELGDFKAIVIAGNETIHQGSLPPLEAAASAHAESIIVNSVFAGSETLSHGGGFGGSFPCHFCSPTPAPTPAPSPDPTPNPIFLEWRELSKAGAGKTLSIDHNQAIPYIESPYDAKIVELTEETNKTFLPFGPDGEREYQRMLRLDRNIRNSGAGSYMDWGNYRSGSSAQVALEKWDLVSAIERPEFDLATVPNEHLPEKLRNLDFDQKLDFILAMKSQRETLQKKSEELRKKRELFVKDELRNRQADGPKDFSVAIREILLEQLKAQGFRL